MIAATAGRLGRIIDRAGNVDEQRSLKMYAELRQLRLRGWLVNGCIAQLTLCAILCALEPSRFTYVHFVLESTSFLGLKPNKYGHNQILY